MNQFVDINNRESLQRLFLALDENALPLWGKMKPQQMVEHLIEEIKWTNGKKQCTCTWPPDKAAAGKQHGVYTDSEIPKNVFVEDLPENYIYPNIPAAVDALMAELGDFDSHFETPGITEVHGAFGDMNHEEWLTWHGKHFTHHLKQFGISGQ